MGQRSKTLQIKKIKFQLPEVRIVDKLSQHIIQTKRVKKANHIHWGEDPDQGHQAATRKACLSDNEFSFCNNELLMTDKKL